jgi:hypothetical protein
MTMRCRRGGRGQGKGQNVARYISFYSIHSNLLTTCFRYLLKAMEKDNDGVDGAAGAKEKVG